MQEFITPELAVTIGALVTIIVGVCEGLKAAGVPSRFVPIISVLAGLGLAIFVFGGGWIPAAAGIVIGLATTGGYRVVKTSVLNQ